MNSELKIIISASRRSDLVANYPQWLAESLHRERISLIFPRGKAKEISLQPEKVHTLVLWSKDFSHLLKNKYGLLDLCRKYDQLYFHFTITGLGGTPIEQHVLRPEEALTQLKPLLQLAGSPWRISLRFDPIVYWWDDRTLRSNFDYFPRLARVASALGLRQIRFSFAQWYRKAKRRAARLGLAYFDPPLEEKIRAAEKLSQIASAFGLELLACAQAFLSTVRGIKPSSCIDGALLSKLHPAQLPASLAKDKTQREECHCTESIDIGSYTQPCPHSCVYCYANSRV